MISGSGWYLKFQQEIYSPITHLKIAFRFRDSIFINQSQINRKRTYCSICVQSISFNRTNCKTGCTENEQYPSRTRLSQQPTKNESSCHLQQTQNRVLVLLFRNDECIAQYDNFIRNKQVARETYNLLAFDGQPARRSHRVVIRGCSRN